MADFMALKEFEGKKVFVVINTKGGQRRYSGKCIEVNFLDNNHTLITIIDKFGKHVCFSASEIALIDEEK